MPCSVVNNETIINMIFKFKFIIVGSMFDGDIGSFGFGFFFYNIIGIIFTDSDGCRGVFDTRH